MNELVATDQGFKPSALGELLPYRLDPDRRSQSDLQSVGAGADLGAEPGEAALDAVQLPPMLPGLPNTPYENCAALICAIVWQAILDRDVHWCAGQRFNFYLSLLGFDNAMILAVKRRVIAQGFTFVRWSNGNWINGMPLGAHQ